MKDPERILMDVSYGLYAIGVNDRGKPTGCIVNTVSQVTAQNPILSFSISKDNYTWEVLEREKQFSVSILSEQTDPTVIGKLGFLSGKDTDKFKDVPYELYSGLPLVKSHCCGHLICEVLAVYPAETHRVVLARVCDGVSEPKQVPMTYRYYHEVIKGKAPKNAPTFHQNTILDSKKKEESAMSEQVSYICTVCGYVYEGDITKEPDDYVCPVCGVGKDLFEKQS